MNQQNVKELVAKMLAEGLSPSQIQQKLANEHNVKLTFLELKLLIAEIDSATENLEKIDEPGKSARNTEHFEEVTVLDEDEEISEEPITPEVLDDSTTVVEIDRIHKPGAVFSGKVKFASGATADWSIDQFGRCMLENTKGTPTQEDLLLFQEELHKKIGGA